MTEKITNRLCVALDVSTVLDASKIVDQLEGITSFWKIGHWLLLARGMEYFVDRLIADGHRIFFDLKLHDIPETVLAGAKRAAERGATWITVHGDHASMQAAVDGVAGTQTQVFIVGRLSSTTAHLDLTVAQEGRAIGCHGVIAPAGSDFERIPRGLVVAVPGVRLNDQTDDHRVTISPGEAIRRGAAIVIVGRPIIRSVNPRVVAKQIMEALDQA